MLTIDNNLIGLKGTIALAEALTMNPIGEDGIKALESALQVNCSLNILEMDWKLNTKELQRQLNINNKIGPKLKVFYFYVWLFSQCNFWDLPQDAFIEILKPLFIILD